MNSALSIDHDTKMAVSLSPNIYVTHIYKYITHCTNYSPMGSDDQSVLQTKCNLTLHMRYKVKMCKIFLHNIII